MALTRWDPFRELELMSDRLNRVFGRTGLLSEVGREPLAVADWAPAVDISETPEEYTVKAELPEVRKEDIKIALEAGVLKISGERKQEKEEKNKQYHRVERFQGSFMRAFSLPATVAADKLQAEFKEGVLTVHLPKTTPTKPSAVEVKVA